MAIGVAESGGVVGHHQCGDAVAVSRFGQDRSHAGRPLWVQGRRGFIGDEDRGRRHQGPSDANPLALTARELSW